MKVLDWADFFDVDESDQTQVLSQFTKQQIDEIYQADNKLSSIEISDIIAEEQIVQGDIFHVQVVLSRQDNIYTDYVIAPHYPKQKEEQWWVLYADRNTNRFHFNRALKLTLDSKHLKLEIMI